MPYSVLLVDDTLPLPTADLGKVMQKVLGGVAYDYMQAINTGYGWVANKLTKDQAEQLVAGLSAAGHEAVCKGSDELLGTGELLQIRKAELGPDALRVEVGLLGKMSPLPWETLSLVSVGRVVVTKTKRVKTKQRSVGISKAGLAMGVTIPVVRTKTTSQSERQEDEDFLVHLVFAEEGVLREFRPTSFDYSYLGQRSRPTTPENFRLLLRDLLSSAKTAQWTSMARNLAEGKDVAHMFQSQKDFLRFTKWRIEAIFDRA
jgi:hypothetical protein